nr:enoyl-CoA hydratase-related protein [Streptomyces yerevanensis]
MPALRPDRGGRERRVLRPRGAHGHRRSGIPRPHLGVGPAQGEGDSLTGRAVTAEEAEQAGMVNRVVPLDELDSAAMELAWQIARMPPFGLRQAKRAVDQTLDVQGFYAAVQSVFDIHETGHGNALSVSGYPILTQLKDMKEHIRKPGGG